MLKLSISDHLLYFCAAIAIKVKLKVFCKRKKRVKETFWAQPKLSDPGMPDGTFSKSFGFIKCVHLIKSP